MLLEGKSIAEKKKSRIKEKIKHFKRKPHLVVVLVGNDEASVTYVNSKKQQCEEVGMKSTVMRFENNISELYLLDVITKLNKDNSVDGILVQLPLPKHIQVDRILSEIDPNKDVDGLNPLNVGLLTNNKPNLIPCTPKGIMDLFDYYEIELEGRNVLVIGRSQLVGRPMLSLLLSRNATVTIAHSKTENLNQLIQNNDIIIVAVGVKEFLKENQLNHNHIIIDVGIHREGKKLVGDVEQSAYDKVKAITPVPKGVGPMTIASLLENTLIAYERKEGLYET